MSHLLLHNKIRGYDAYCIASYSIRYNPTSPEVEDIK